MVRQILEPGLHSSTLRICHWVECGAYQRFEFVQLTELKLTTLDRCSARRTAAIAVLLIICWRESIFPPRLTNSLHYLAKLARGTQKQRVPNQCDFTSGSGLRSTAINVSVCLSVRWTTCPNIITFSERCRRLTSFKFKSVKIDIEVRFSRLSIMSPQRKQDF